MTTALPGLIGLVLGGRLAEQRGRKPVAIVALLIATSTQMVFFLQGGTVLWVTSAVSVLTSAAAGIALGTLDAELFPTELRGTSNALLLIVSVLGSGRRPRDRGNLVGSARRHRPLDRAVRHRGHRRRDLLRAAPPRDPRRRRSTT